MILRRKKLSPRISAHTTGRNHSWLWLLRLDPIYWVKWKCWKSAVTRFMVHSGCRIPWWLSILRLTQSVVEVRPNKVRFPSTKVSYQDMPILVQFCLRVAKMLFILTRQLEMQRIELKSKLWPDLSPKPLVLCQVLFHCKMCWRLGIEWYWNCWYNFIILYVINIGHISEH